MSYSTPSEPDNSVKIGKSSSGSPPEQDDLPLGILEKMSSLTLPAAHGDSDALENGISASSPEPDSSRDLSKHSFSSISELADHGTLEQMAPYVKQLVVDKRACDTLDKYTSSSKSQTDYSCKVFEDLQHTVTVTYIYSSNELRAKLKKTQKKFTKEEASEFKKMLIESRNNMHILFMQIDNYLNNLLNTLRKGMEEDVIPNEKPSDGETLQQISDKQISDKDLFSKPEDILYRSLTRTVLKDYENESEMEPCEPHELVVIDEILDKCRRARKLAKWFLYKVYNHEIFCDDLLYTWIYNSLNITSYTNLIEICLRVSDKIEKEKMYNIYIKYHKEDIENHYLIKLHQSEKELEESNRKHKIRAAWKPRFKKGRSCTLEHTMPVCELCGSQTSTWLNTFEKRGIHIREAPHWNTDHIWYNRIIDV